ncbi:hypothetical protein, partial [Hydrogenimonas sp.]
LKEKLPFEIAPATIRYYFNQMVERGELAQLHKSSGRIPTESTMKRYWRKHLRELELLSDAMSEVARISESENLFMLFKPVKSNRLRALEKVGERYLILVFESDEYVIRHQNQLELFLGNLIGYELEEVKRIAKDVGMMSLYYKMRAKNEEEITTFNSETLIRVAGEKSSWGKRNIRAFLDGDIIEELSGGLYFDPLLPKGFMALRMDSVIEQRPMKLLCIGAIDQDFTKIFKEV